MIIILEYNMKIITETHKLKLLGELVSNILLEVGVYKP